MQFKEEWRAFLSNIKSIKENRRITNFPYAFAIINIHIIYTWTMLILLASVLGGRVTMTVDKGITMSATSPFLISGPTFYWCAAILVFITNLLVAVLIKRRYNDVNRTWAPALGTFAFIVVMITNLVLCITFLKPIFIGAHLSLDDTFMFMFRGSAIMHLVCLASCFLRKNKARNTYGLPDGGQVIGNYELTYETIMPIAKEGESWTDSLGIGKGLESYKYMFFDGVIDYKSRTKRHEIFWGNVLFWLIYIIIAIILQKVLPFAVSSYFVNEFMNNFYGGLMGIWWLAANIAACYRRLHDAGRSAFWILGFLIPFVNVYSYYLVNWKPSLKTVNPVSHEE